MANRFTLKQKIIEFLSGVWLVLGGIAYNAMLVGHLAENAWWGWAVFIGLGAPWCRWVWKEIEWENRPDRYDKKAT